jgi:uncharacterized membrane protein YeaQ/YmgE (transglycosylase-associated protein family)
MNIFIWLVVGGSVGWLATLLTLPDRQQGMFLNVVVGILGAALGGWLLGPLFGVSLDQSSFSAASFLVSLLGAVILVVSVNFARRGSAR